MTATLEEVLKEYERMEDICKSKENEYDRNDLIRDSFTSLRARFGKLVESDKISERGKQLANAIAELSKTCYDDKRDPLNIYEGEEDETEAAAGGAAEGAAAGGAGKGKRKSRKSRNQRKRRSQTRRKYRRTTKS
jgi:hypothetical protein